MDTGKCLTVCNSVCDQLPRNVATVGKKRAPQNVLVTETGSEAGGIEAAAPLPSLVG